jgi:hypothetical protein
MTMYLSNQAVRPTGYEAAEFIDSEANAPWKPSPREVPDEGDEESEQ